MNWDDTREREADRQAARDATALAWVTLPSPEDQAKVWDCVGRGVAGAPPFVTVNPCQFRPSSDPARGDEVGRWLASPTRVPVPHYVPMEAKLPDAEAPDAGRVLLDVYLMAHTAQAAGKELRVKAAGGYLIAELVPGKAVAR